MTAITGSWVVERCAGHLGPIAEAAVRAAAQEAIRRREDEVRAEISLQAEQRLADKRLAERAELFRQERDHLALQIAPLRTDVVHLRREISSLQARLATVEPVLDAASAHLRWPIAGRRARLCEALRAAGMAAYDMAEEIPTR